ncbi:MerR family transcriptional regulator [Clostridium botulinum]|uniref:MerR family transcriptional regulator n=1 Tax=Clostridium botulinum TaxID=1491 RepID=A0A846J1N5_CLOBO|nr:MerR family transcriptional regulator [Clostridium botulinum]ACA56618.1 transcriptional regulator, MerR family protein [Clostridium botulinum A3 str. Loch Maree]NFH64200.1 MerR family transcriptional regulator [Clostridium botulinum]NFJ07221.1 MerR family transcriptional regulator [Clostridium botulinum]NFK14193.1 MerR family transcriptional regulator [Clostridium botulinum]NFM92151.1 MerR family transcriptional regulator [Clostridium botulinum]
MLISEVCNLTGLTKKAISYYEQQGLVKPIRGVNKYREYSQLDVKLLNEISLYRSLDICISDIKKIIDNENKKEIINKIILENKHKKELDLKRQRAYLQKINNNNFFENDIGEEIEKDSIKINLNYEKGNNIGINLENTKETLGICLKYIKKIGKLDELIIITQYSASELIELLNGGIMTPRLASYIMDIIEIDIQVLVGVRKLTYLEKIVLYVE